MSKIVYLNHQEGGIETVSAALGDGRTLGLNPNQLDTIKKNVKDQVTSFNKPSIEPVSEPVMPTSEVAPSPIPVIEPVQEPVSASFVAPVVPENSPVNDPVVVPNIVPPVSPEPTPVVEGSVNNNVEIVSNSSKKTDYDTLMEEIASLNQRYQTELNTILEKYQAKMNAYETQINDLKGKAEEHLKNAQAAETIATIAHQNAQNAQFENPGIL